MAQDTQESVHDVYQAVGEISEGARNQADETTDANTNVVRIGEQIEYISDKVNSLTDYAGRMAEAEKASEEIMKELNSSNESTKESVLRVAEQIKDMNGAIQNILPEDSMIFLMICSISVAERLDWSASLLICSATTAKRAS